MSYNYLRNREVGNRLNYEEHIIRTAIRLGKAECLVSIDTSWNIASKWYDWCVRHGVGGYSVLARLRKALAPKRRRGYL